MNNPFQLCAPLFLETHTEKNSVGLVYLTESIPLSGFIVSKE